MRTELEFHARIHQAIALTERVHPTNDTTRDTDTPRSLGSDPAGAEIRTWETATRGSNGPIPRKGGVS